MLPHMGEPSEKRLREIARRHRPRGWRVVERGDPTPPARHNPAGKWVTVAECDYTTKTIYTLPIVNRYALYVFLHECGHANLQSTACETCGWEEELEAEQYARAAMRAAGIPIMRVSLDEGPDYVEAYMRGDCPAPDPETLRFCGYR